MCEAWRWVSGWGGSQPPDNIDSHSAWGVWVELSIAEEKAALLRALHDPSKHITHLSVSQFSAWPLFVKHNASAEKASLFTLAFSWPFTPFLPPFWEQSLKSFEVTVYRRLRLSFRETSECSDFVLFCDAAGMRRGEGWDRCSRVKEKKDNLENEDASSH